MGKFKFNLRIADIVVIVSLLVLGTVAVAREAVKEAPVTDETRIEWILTHDDILLYAVEFIPDKAGNHTIHSRLLKSRGEIDAAMQRGGWEPLPTQYSLQRGILQ